jgi:hypothetical protein
MYREVAGRAPNNGLTGLGTALARCTNAVRCSDWARRIEENEVV